MSAGGRPTRASSRSSSLRSGQSRGIGGYPYYGYVDRLHERVVQNFARFAQRVDGRRVSLHKGLFQDTHHRRRSRLPTSIATGTTRSISAWKRIVPWLSEGAYVVLDDYNDYGGCRRAVDEL